MGAAPFTPGSTVVQRNVLAGRVMSAYPGRVIADDGGGLSLAHWPGTECLVSGGWAAAMESGRPDRRAEALLELGRGDWALVPWTWRATSLVHEMEEGRWFSVNRFHDPASGALLWWYVNFQRPFTRVDGGVDTLDLLVDLVAGPDLTWRWKDEDEYAHGRRLGMVTEAEHRAVAAAREEVVAMMEARQAPFCDSAPSWLPQPDWPLPRLP